ncbi:CBS domain-containing protein [Martelella lutilitoris]|uniref:CBS domain-containing protein n=1 Tax=Martelella lutilitoris TaxID=2583532 RepID=A0A5C4JZ90_9HYPH|nr:CBS domain-containing protein [Martelella lutilitoris]TNB49899.1 CBS domain-containing protein [Martelella lutilitoris]
MTDTIAEITKTDALTVTPDMPIRRAVALLVESRAAAAPVVDEGGALCGILTQKDCFNPALQASYYQEWKGTVGDYMSRNVVSLPASTDLVAAAEAFISHPHRVFPVTDGNRLVGLLRRSDVLSALVRLSG